MTLDPGAGGHNGTGEDVSNLAQEDPSSLSHRRGQTSVSATTGQHTRNGSNDLGQQNDNAHPTKGGFKSYFRRGGNLRPFRLLKQDLVNLKSRYISDWTVFNQQVIASAVYIFFTNILPGITFASDLFSLTGESWGTIEIVFSTGLCGIIFAT